MLTKLKIPLETSVGSGSLRFFSKKKERTEQKKEEGRRKKEEGRRKRFQERARRPEAGSRKPEVSRNEGEVSVSVLHGRVGSREGAVSQSQWSDNG